jgi:glutathione S-transferase
MIKLYDTPASGNCHKARLMLGLLGLDYRKINVDLSAKEQMKPEFVALNPLRKVPVLDDNGYVLRDSQAILVYLAEKYGKGKWYPKDAEGRGEVQQWLSLAVNEVFNGLAICRAIAKFGRKADPKVAREIGEQALHVMQLRLKQRNWLATHEPTIADIACYPYTALANEGGVPLRNHPAVIAWIERFEKLPGYVSMPGLPWPGDPPAKSAGKGARAKG